LQLLGPHRQRGSAITVTVSLRRICVTFSAALALTGAAVLAAATPASARRAPVAVTAAMPAIATVFDLNGRYTDGVSARPRITDVSDRLTIDMSYAHRPTATGIVINASTILVTFPDDATYTGTLLAPGTIVWSNRSLWFKL